MRTPSALIIRTGTGPPLDHRAMIKYLDNYLDRLRDNQRLT